LKLNKFFERSEIELPTQLKVMQLTYLVGNIIANRWAKRAEFNRCVAETYKSEALDTVGADESRVVEVIREKLKDGYKNEIENNYKMEKMKLHSQVRTAECKEKQMFINMKKRRDDLEILKTELSSIEDKIKTFNEQIYSREYKVEMLQNELKSVKEQHEAMQSIEDVENVIQINNQTMKKLKNELYQKSQIHTNIINKKYALDKEHKILQNRLFEEQKKLNKTQQNVNELKEYQEAFGRRQNLEEKNKSHLTKQVRAAVNIIKHGYEFKDKRRQK